MELTIRVALHLEAHHAHANVAESANIEMKIKMKLKWPTLSHNFIHIQPVTSLHM